METSRKVILLQMTSLIMSRMMTQSEMMATHGHSPPNKGLTSETRRSRDISHHVGHDGRVRGLGGLRRGRDKNFGGGAGQRPRLEVPEGFDLSTAERQEDGQFCVYKKLSLEGKCTSHEHPIMNCWMSELIDRCRQHVLYVFYWQQNFRINANQRKLHSSWTLDNVLLNVWVNRHVSRFKLCSIGNNTLDKCKHLMWEKFHLTPTKENLSTPKKQKVQTKFIVPILDLMGGIFRTVYLEHDQKGYF